MNWKGFRRKRHCPNRGIILELSWRGLGKPQLSFKIMSCPIFEQSNSLTRVYNVNSKFGKLNIVYMPGRYDRPGNKGNGDDVIPQYYVGTSARDPYRNVCARIILCRINSRTAWLKCFLLRLSICE
jgi:hypothetical protein